jgi:Alpha-tubulin suppressor and related RCC1 domain-containing proteins
MRGSSAIARTLSETVLIYNAATSTGALSLTAADFGPIYTVSYNANNATSGSPPSSGAYFSGESATISGNSGSLAKTGYAFVCWNTQADGSGTSYYSGDAMTLSASDVVLYAQWFSSSPVIAVGVAHSLVVKADGNLWSVGRNAYGELGDGTTSSKLTAAQVLGVSGVKAVSASDEHSLILLNNGDLYACGDNWYGELGLTNSATKTSTPTLVASGVASMSMGGNFSLIVKNDGSLWACGDNSCGQLGDGTLLQRNSFVEILTSGVASVSAGWRHSLVVKTDGTLWGMGSLQGQFGISTSSSDIKVPQSLMSGVASASACGLRESSAYTFFSMIIKTDNTLWATGSNKYGQLCDGTTTDHLSPVQVMDSVAAVSSGGLYTMVLKKDCTLWACGYNNYGQLGNGSTTSQSTPVKVMSGVAQVASSFDIYYPFTLLVKTNGTVWGVGANCDGQLGIGTKQTEAVTQFAQMTF